MMRQLARPSALAACLLLTATGVASSPARADGPFVVGALGDSISAGFDAERIGDNRELSWATGNSTEVMSHARRLAAEGRQVTSYNEAIAGSIVTDLDRQVTRLLTHAPDYVTVTMGANDICTWNPDYQGQLAAFETELKAQVGRLVQSRPQIKVVIAPIPDMVNLWSIAHDQPGCQQRWDLMGICRPLLAQGVTADQRAAFSLRWEAANAAIARVAQAFPANVIFDPDAVHTHFEWQHVSQLDCFHPSVAGQNLLSDIAWKQVAAEGL